MKLVCSNTSAQRNRSTTSTPPGTNGVSINFGNDEHQCTRTKRKEPTTTTEKKCAKPKRAATTYSSVGLFLRKGGTEANFRNHFLFSGLAMLGPGELHPGCVPRTKLATRDTGYQSRCFSQIMKDVFFGEKRKVTGSRVTGHCSRKDLCFGSTAPSSPLLHKRSQGPLCTSGRA